MAQQVGSSTSGIASAHREIQVATAEAGQAEAGQAKAGPAGAAANEAGPAGEGQPASRPRAPVRPGPRVAAARAVRGRRHGAPGAERDGGRPELDLASNDPLVGFLLSAASAVDITGLQLQSPALKALREAAWSWWSR